MPFLIGQFRLLRITARLTFAFAQQDERLKRRTGFLYGFGMRFLPAFD